MIRNPKVVKTSGKGGGNRYGPVKQVLDMTTDEPKFCGCWRCTEQRRGKELD